MTYTLSEREQQRERDIVAGATGPRSDIRTTEPTRVGDGTSRRWTRTIRGVPYAFTAVTMPNGERRYFASRYNGYGDNGTAWGRFSGMRFGCAWTPVHSVTVPATRAVVPEIVKDEPAPSPITIQVQLERIWDECTAAHNQLIGRRDVARREMRRAMQRQSAARKAKHHRVADRWAAEIDRWYQVTHRTQVAAMRMFDRAVAARRALRAHEQFEGLVSYR